MIAATECNQPNVSEKSAEFSNMSDITGRDFNYNFMPNSIKSVDDSDTQPVVFCTAISNATQPKSFTCQVCQKSFSNKANKDKHFRNLHLMERKECSICKKILSNVYNLKRHVRSAHGAYLDQKTGMIHDQNSDYARRSVSPVSSNEDITQEYLFHERDHDAPPKNGPSPDFREWDSSSRESEYRGDSSRSNSPTESSCPPFQSFFEAFIPARYRDVENGSFDGAVSDNDNLNYIEDDDDIAAIIKDSATPNYDRGGSVKAVPKGQMAKHAMSASPQPSPQHFQQNDLQSSYLAQFGLVRSTDAKDDSANNNNIVIIEKSTSYISEEEVFTMRRKEERQVMDKIENFFALTSFKESTEGKAERAKIRKKGKAEKERIRRICGKASRKSNRVARKKGRDSPEEDGELYRPATGDYASGNVVLSSNGANEIALKAVAESRNTPITLPKRNVIITRQRSKTK